MEKIRSKPGLLNFYQTRPESVRSYFAHLPRLIEGFPLDVALAYVFAQVETAQRMAIYCGVTKLHSCNSPVAWRAITAHRMTRNDFREKVDVIYGKRVPETTSQLIVIAEGVRDRIIHGKAASDDDKRNAIAHVLQYAYELNEFMVTVGAPKPFGDLRGFKGAAKSLAPATHAGFSKAWGSSVNEAPIQSEVSTRSRKRDFECHPEGTVTHF